MVYENLIHMKDVVKDEQAWANRYLEKITFPSGTEAVLPIYPVRFSEYEVKGMQNIGEIGADTAEVLKGLGYADGEINTLAAERVIKNR